MKALTGEEIMAKARLKQLRKAIVAENISYGEIAELQSLAKFIDKNDTLLLGWVGCCEGCGEPILPEQSQADGRHTTCL